MLSRVANTFYWMVRYVERADNLARLIDVNQQLLLDSEQLDRQQLNAIWEPIIQSAGDDEAFHALHADANSAEAVDFLALDRRNPNSKFHLSLGISYPNADDIAAARSAGAQFHCRRVQRHGHRQQRGDRARPL